jgi:hypothetical protein
MMKDDWDAHMAFDIRHAEKVLTTSGEVIPMFIVHGLTGKYAIATPWRDDREKRQCIEVVRLFCAAHDAYALSMLVEAWTASAVHDGTDKDAARSKALAGLPPSQRPDRQEVVLALCVTFEAGKRRVRQRMHPIIRGADGKPIGLGLDLHAGDEDTAMEGRMVDILPSPAFPLHLRKMARDLLAKMPSDIATKLAS